MSIQTINVGGYSNDGTGDDLRTAFLKVNANFAELGSVSGITNGANLGTGVGVFAQRNATDPVLEFRTLTSVDDSIEITATTNTVNLRGLSKVENDPAPMLAADLDLNSYRVINGDVQSTVFGIDVRSTNALLELMLISNAVTISFGTFLEPAGGTGFPGDSGIVLDMNGQYVDGFVITPSVGNYNFGTFV